MFDDAGLTRKQFLTSLVLSATAAAVPALGQQPGQEAPPNEITADDLKSMEKIFGVSFTEEERRQLLADVRNQTRGYAAVRQLPITYQVEPPTVFSPLARPSSEKGVSVKVSSVGRLSKPAQEVDLAFMSVRELAHLVKTKQISPVELTRVFLGRLERHGTELLNVVTLTPELAMSQAKRAEQEIMSGKYRGALHGIPCGVKDLFATKGIATTWGSEPHKTQVFDYDAAVVERLEAAGAVLCAKLSMGALAQGDVWFAGRTKNPWNTEQGSSGSSAGSASAVAAGLLPYAIGTETLGSIISPSFQCRVTGLRPTYGRVSRYGAMAVSWTMDKIGPICREVEDCAIVLAAIAGYDARDRSTVDRPFHWRPDLDLKKLKIGFLAGQNDSVSDTGWLKNEPSLQPLLARGVPITPVRFDPMPGGISVILGVEAAAAFDEFTRSDKIHQLQNSAWPRTYRSNRYVPAVEYLEAQRGRALLMESVRQRFGDFDVIVARANGGAMLSVTNYTGHPQVVIPQGVGEDNRPRAVSFFGQPYEEDKLLAVARIVQEAGNFHKLRPAGYSK